MQVPQFVHINDDGFIIVYYIQTNSIFIVSEAFHRNHIWVGSATLPTSRGIWFFLSWTIKMNGRSTTTSFWSPKKAAEKISPPVAAAPSLPSFVTWPKLGQDGRGRKEMNYDKRPPLGTRAWSCSLRWVLLKFPPTQHLGWTPESINIAIVQLVIFFSLSNRVN